MVIGATHSGYILHWDIRAKTLPVQKSCSSKLGHKLPIYSLQIIGSQNAHNIVSVSNDGRCCFWSFGMLTEPKKQFDLASVVGTETQPIHAHCMDFPEEETDSFYIGAEDYNIY